MTYKNLQTTFERELLFQIITNLRNKSLTSERAKEITHSFLPILKSENQEEFIKKVGKLSEIYREIREAFLKAINTFEKDNIEERLQKIRNELLNVSPVAQLTVQMVNREEANKYGI